MINMKAGRELDALIAEKVMGWTRYPDRHGLIVMSRTGTPYGQFDQHPYYSTGIADAWEIVEKLRLAIGPDKDDESMWYCTKLGATTHGCTAETAPLAICHTALKMMGYD